MRPSTGLIEQKDSAPRHNFTPKINKGCEDLFDIKLFWAPVVNGQHINAKTGLHIGMPIELIERYFCLVIAFNLNNKAHTVTIRLIARFCNTLNNLLLTQLVNTLDKISFIDLIRQLINNNCLTIFADFFDPGPGTHNDGTLPFVHRCTRARAPQDLSPCWKVRSRENLHYLIYRNTRVIQIEITGVNNLT